HGRRHGAVLYLDAHDAAWRVAGPLATAALCRASSRRRVAGALAAGRPAGGRRGDAGDRRRGLSRRRSGVDGAGAAAGAGMRKYRPYIVGAIGGVLAAAIVPLTGIVDFDASNGQWGVTDWFLNTSAQQSITLRSAGLGVPDL